MHVVLLVFKRSVHQKEASHSLQYLALQWDLLSCTLFDMFEISAPIHLSLIHSFISDINVRFKTWLSKCNMKHNRRFSPLVLMKVTSWPNWKIQRVWKFLNKSVQKSKIKREKKRFIFLVACNKKHFPINSRPLQVVCQTWLTVAE